MMPQYRVTLISSMPTGPGMHDGYPGKLTKLQIRALQGALSRVYEGRGGGKLYEERCQRLAAPKGVVVEAAEPRQYGPDTAWEQAVVDGAFAQADNLSAA
jgi:hypothetical protein